MAFKLTKYSYKSLRQMSVQDRLAAAQDREMGQWLLSLLTPSQFVELFPDYYRRGLPDISGFMKAMPSSMSAAKQAAMEEQLQNTASGSAAGSNMAAGGWRKKWQEGMSRATPTRAGVVPPPQLSPEQRKYFEDLKAGPLAADDPRAKMFAGLSTEQMSQVGISKYSEGGKEFFRYAAPTVGEKEAKEYIATSSELGSASRKYESGNRGVAMISSGAGDAGGVSYGTHQLSSKDGMPGFLRSNEGSAYASRFAGLTPGSAAFNSVYRQIVSENPQAFEAAQHAYISRTHYDPVKSHAASLGYDTSDRRVQEALFSMGVQHGRANQIVSNAGSGAGKTPDEQVRALFNARRAYVDQQGLGYLKSRYANEERDILGVSTYAGPADYSQKSIELAQERLIRQLEERRIGSLAEFTSAQLPAPGSAEANSMVGGSKNPTAVAERIRNEFGNLSNQECVALAKAYVGATGSVTDWRRGTNILDGTLQPGTPIATFMDRSGNPSSLYDAGGTGAPGNHTTHAAVFMDYVRDGSGKITGIKVMEQYAGSGGAKEKVYPVGGFGTNNAANYFSINDTQGRPLGPNNPMLQTSPTETPPAATDKPPVPTPAQPASSVETPQVLNKQVAESVSETPPKAASQEPPQVAAAAPQAPPQAPPQVAAQITPERYTVNVTKFIQQIKNTPDFKNNALSWMATDSMILSGFNDDARVKAAGVVLDDKGVMHFKKGMTPEVKQVMAEFDTKSFMTKIEDKKKEEKKPVVTPVEQKPVEKATTQPAPQVTSQTTNKEPAKAQATPTATDKSPVPTPTQPASSVEAPQVQPKQEKAPAKVKTNAAGGENKVNTEQISAYPIGGIKSDNVVVVNKQQQPLFTMNTNESVTMNPKTDMATVTPNTKDRKIGEANRPSIVEGMFDQFNQSVRELSSKFEQNKGVPEQAERPDPFPPEGGAWINNLNKLTEKEFHSPSARRAFYRAGGAETGEPHSGFHFSHGNRS